MKWPSWLAFLARHPSDARLDALEREARDNDRRIQRLELRLAVVEARLRLEAEEFGG